MARPSKIPYDKIIPKYQTGAYSITKLAKEFKVSKSTLSKYINDNNITVSEQAKDAIVSINSGFSSLRELVSEQINEHPIQNVSKGTLIVDEVLHIVRKRNPEFVDAFQTISAKILHISNSIIDNGIKDTKDLKNITSAIKDINDTLQVVPKPPAFAQQININKNNNNKKSETIKDIKIEIVK